MRTQREINILINLKRESIAKIKIYRIFIGYDKLFILKELEGLKNENEFKDVKKIQKILKQQIEE